MCPAARGDPNEYWSVRPPAVTVMLTFTAWYPNVRSGCPRERTGAGGWQSRCGHLSPVTHEYVPLYAALSEGKEAVPVNFPLEGFLSNRLGDDVDLALQHSGEQLFQLVEPVEIIESTGGKCFAESNRDIYVCRVGLATGG